MAKVSIVVFIHTQKFILWWKFVIVPFFIYLILFYFFVLSTFTLLVAYFNSLSKFFIIYTKYGRVYFIQDWAVLIVFKCLCACMNFFCCCCCCCCCPFFYIPFNNFINYAFSSLTNNIAKVFRIQLIKWFEID